MSDRSPIEWTDATWNPTTGCDRISPGCDNCYALHLAKRLKAMRSDKYQTDGSARTSGPGFGLAIHPHTLAAPVSWRTPRRIFVDSMSDLFHPDVPVDFIRQVFGVAAEADQHIYQILTKRSHRLAALADALDWHPNIWIGVSVETGRYAYRVDHLRRVPAAVRFVSAEPLLGPLSGLGLDRIHWLIVGGESGPRARPMRAAWVRELRDLAEAASVPFFFKQWGGFHSKAGGRVLDGRSHDAFPAGVAS